MIDGTKTAERSAPGRDREFCNFYACCYLIFFRACFIEMGRYVSDVQIAFSVESAMANVPRSNVTGPPLVLLPE